MQSFNTHKNIQSEKSIISFMYRNLCKRITHSQRYTHTHTHTHTHIDTAICMHYMDVNKTAGEETGWQLHKNAACNPEQVLAAAPHKTPTVRPPAPYHENYSS